MLYNTGTLVIETGATTRTNTDSFGSMKKCAARVLGGENQAYYLNLAGEGILKGIDVINMKHVFRFGSFQTSDTTLIDATDTYAVDSGTFAIQEVQLVRQSDSKVVRTLEYVPWGQFNSLEKRQTSTGAPEFWTARSLYQDQTVTVYPVPTASEAATYDIRITYYKRIARLTADADVIVAPRELSECLCTYAEYYLLRLKNKDNPTLYLERKRAFDEQLADFVLSTEREPTENLQWVLAPDNVAPNPSRWPWWP